MRINIHMEENRYTEDIRRKNEKKTRENRKKTEGITEKNKYDERIMRKNEHARGR